jgi:hypothetical protein
MKKYTNNTHSMKTVLFKDGSAQFLMRGQSFESDKEIERVSKGVLVKDVVKPKTAKKPTEETN